VNQQTSTSHRFREQWLVPSGRFYGAFWLAALLLTAIGARLWLLHAFGTPLPFWDQWEESRVVFVPYFEGKLTLHDLMSGHNENRIFIPRLYALGLLLINGQFDNFFEMVCNVFLYCATIGGFAVVLARMLGRRLWPLIAVAFTLALSFPFSWESTLAGFHSQFYIMAMFCLLTIWLMGFKKPGSLLWCAGVLAGLCAVFSMAAGLLAAAAVCGLACLRILVRPPAWKQHWLTLVVASVIVVVGLALKVEVPHHNVLKAHSALQFLNSLGKFLAWPWIVIPPWALGNMLPLGLLCWLYLRNPQTRGPAEEMVLVLGLWAVLNALAGAYARGAQQYPQWRYMDLTCYVAITNALALGVLGTRHLQRLPWKQYFRSGAGLWAAACLLGLVALDYRAFTVDIPQRVKFERMQMLTTRAYAATGDPAVLHVERYEYLPYFEGFNLEHGDHPKAFMQVFDAPPVHSFLPACVREPLQLHVQKNIGFATNSPVPIEPNVPGERFWISQGKTGAARFEGTVSKPSPFAFLELRIAGDFTEGTSLSLIETASGKVAAIKPGRGPGAKWQTVQVRAPKDEFKVVASDSSANGWIAFQEPRELAFGSWAAGRIIDAGLGLFVAGLVVYVVGAAGAVRKHEEQVHDNRKQLEIEG
jgi:hypothetical protein